MCQTFFKNVRLFFSRFHKTGLEPNVIAVQVRSHVGEFAGSAP